MREGARRRTLVCLTVALLGLTGVFASLTLVALGRSGPAAALAAAGVVAIAIGLRCLPTGPS
jgi:hypothetical protein